MFFVGLCDAITNLINHEDDVLLKINTIIRLGTFSSVNNIANSFRSSIFEYRCGRLDVFCVVMEPVFRKKSRQECLPCLAFVGEEFNVMK